MGARNEFAHPSQFSGDTILLDFEDLPASAGGVPPIAGRRLPSASFRRRDLPGAHDLVFARRLQIVFVPRCFCRYHSHPPCKRPASSRSFWECKLDRNISRDRKNIAALERNG